MPVSYFNLKPGYRKKTFVSTFRLDGLKLDLHLGLKKLRCFLFSGHFYVVFSEYDSVQKEVLASTFRAHVWKMRGLQKCIWFIAKYENPRELDSYSYLGKFVNYDFSNQQCLVLKPTAWDLTHTPTEMYTFYCSLASIYAILPTFTLSKVLKVTNKLIVWMTKQLLFHDIAN